MVLSVEVSELGLVEISGDSMYFFDKMFELQLILCITVLTEATLCSIAINKIILELDEPFWDSVQKN